MFVSFEIFVIGIFYFLFFVIVWFYVLIWIGSKVLEVVDVFLKFGVI